MFPLAKWYSLIIDKGLYDGGFIEVLICQPNFFSPTRLITTITRVSVVVFSFDYPCLGLYFTWAIRVVSRLPVIKEKLWKLKNFHFQFDALLQPFSFLCKANSINYQSNMNNKMNHHFNRSIFFYFSPLQVKQERRTNTASSIRTISGWNWKRSTTHRVISRSVGRRS